MKDDRRIRFAKTKLVGLAQMWWYVLEGCICLHIVLLRPKFFQQRINSRRVCNTFEECMQRLEAINTPNRVMESPRLTSARLDTSVKPITKLPQPKASVEHVHQMSPKPKGVVEDTNSTKLMSQETDYVMSQETEYVPNPPKVGENQIFKAENAPMFEVKDLQQVSDIVASAASVETTEHVCTCRFLC